jgi:hypothetical protein
MVRSMSLVVMVLLISHAASAQNRRGAPDEDACHGDSHRFCQSVFPPERDLPPDQFKMFLCLQEHRAKLSKACSEMLRGHGV